MYGKYILVDVRGLLTSWEFIEDEIRVFVHADEICWSKLVMGNKADDREEDGLFWSALLLNPTDSTHLSS